METDASSASCTKQQCYGKRQSENKTFKTKPNVYNSVKPGGTRNSGKVMERSWVLNACHRTCTLFPSAAKKHQSVYHPADVRTHSTGTVRTPQLAGQTGHRILGVRGFPVNVTNTIQAGLQNLLLQLLLEKKKNRMPSDMQLSSPLARPRRMGLEGLVSLHYREISS